MYTTLSGIIIEVNFAQLKKEFDCKFEISQLKNADSYIASKVFGNETISKFEC